MTFQHLGGNPESDTFHAVISLQKNKQEYR